MALRAISLPRWAEGGRYRSGAGADIKPGNCLPFENIPVGTIIHNISCTPAAAPSWCAPLATWLS